MLVRGDVTILDEPIRIIKQDQNQKHNVMTVNSDQATSTQTEQSTLANFLTVIDNN